MSSFLFLQQCHAGLVCLARIVFLMGGRWSYSCCFVGCCLQDLFNIACSILVQLPSIFFSIRLLSVHVLHPYSSIDTTALWKKCVLFHLSGLSFIWPIDYRLLSMSFLVAYWCHFRLMRRCFLGMWTYLLVSKAHHLVRRCRLFDLGTCILSCPQIMTLNCI